MQQLTQNSIGESRKFVILPDALHVIHKSSTSTLDYLVPFDEFPLRRRVYYRSHPILLYTAASFLFAAAVIPFTAKNMVDALITAPIGLLFGALLIVAFFIERGWHYVLESPDFRVAFLKDKPSKAEFEAFITSILAARMSFLQKTYCTPQGPDALAYLKALDAAASLFTAGLIDAHEFRNIKQDILRSTTIDLSQWKIPPNAVTD